MRSHFKNITGFALCAIVLALVIWGANAPFSSAAEVSDQ